MTNGATAVTDGSRGAFCLDSTVPGAVPRGYDAFRDGWEAQVGAGIPLPDFTAATIRNLRARTRVARLHDVAITDIHTATSLETASPWTGLDDQILLHVVRRGAWTLDGLADRGEQTVPADRFLLRHIRRPFHFETALHTTTEHLVLPSEPLAALLGSRSITGPTDTAEMRLLTAHATMVHATVADLSPAGVHAAHSTLIELAKAVARQRFDDAEPLLAPALAQAAREVADRRLTDPELSPVMLARELKVSIRTLQRAFATSGESPAAYIRRRRLEAARRALTAPSGRLSVSELAVRWHFADTSHFTRAFKKYYGQTPTEYARSNRPA